MATHRTLRETIELQSARNAPMYERLKRAQIDSEGLRDMRHLHRVHQQEETGAMRALGWLFVFISGAALGACVAGWWVGIL